MGSRRSSLSVSPQVSYRQFVPGDKPVAGRFELAAGRAYAVGSADAADPLLHFHNTGCRKYATIRSSATSEDQEKTSVYKLSQSGACDKLLGIIIAVIK